MEVNLITNTFITENNFNPLQYSIEGFFLATLGFQIERQTYDH